MATDTSQASIRTSGAWAAVGAFLLWGVLPVYWKNLHDIPATELIAHRVVWSLGLLLIVIRSRQRWAEFVAALRDVRVSGLYLLSGVLLAAKWLIYVWAVNANQIVETSLGYFLNPLCNVALGFLVLRERLEEDSRGVEESRIVAVVGHHEWRNDRPREMGGSVRVFTAFPCNSYADPGGAVRRQS